MLDNPRSPRVRSVAKLAKKAARAETGAFLLEGPQAAREALTWRPELVVDLYATTHAFHKHDDVASLAKNADVRVEFVTDQVLDAMADTVTPQGFVAVCRTYASELAINEVTLRTYSDLQHYVEQSTEALVQSLRGGDIKTRAYRQMQVEAAIRFCDVLFGHDYASLMSRAAENALTGERKPSRAG